MDFDAGEDVAWWDVGAVEVDSCVWCVYGYDCVFAVGVWCEVVFG